MARFSIVVPLNESSSSFEETLASVLRYRPDQSQVIVVHEGVYDDPYGLGKEVDFVSVDKRRTSGSQLISMFNAGVAAARGSYLGFLRPSVQLTEHWEIPIWKAFVDPEVGIVSPALVSIKTPNQVIATGIEAGPLLQRRLAVCGKKIGTNKQIVQPLGATSWGGFYRKSILDAIGEVDPTLDGHYLDLELALSFHSLKLSSVYIQECQLTSDSTQLILDEQNKSHGCSAQRAMTRFKGLVSGVADLTPFWSGVKEFLTQPWSLSNLKQARQRLAAAKFTETDLHHHELLEVLLKQRTRLVSAGLHSRVAAHERSASHAENRRAA